MELKFISKINWISSVQTIVYEQKWKKFKQLNTTLRNYFLCSSSAYHIYFVWSAILTSNCMDLEWLIVEKIKCWPLFLLRRRKKEEEDEARRRQWERRQGKEEGKVCGVENGGRGESGRRIRRKSRSSSRRRKRFKKPSNTCILHVNSFSILIEN